MTDKTNQNLNLTKKKSSEKSLDKSNKNEPFKYELKDPVIVNVVGSLVLNCQLNLEEIHPKLSNSKYSQIMNSISWTCSEPKASAKIFKTGKIVITGAKSEKDTSIAGNKLSKALKSLGFVNEIQEFKIVNIVGTYDTKFPINLTKLRTKLNTEDKEEENQKNFTKFNYEPDVFPGLIYNMKNPKLVITIFASGKVNFTGAKNQNDLKEALKKIYPYLLQFKNELKKNNIFLLDDKMPSKKILNKNIILKIK